MVAECEIDRVAAVKRSHQPVRSGYDGTLRAQRLTRGRSTDCWCRAPDATDYRRATAIATVAAVAAVVLITLLGDPVALGVFRFVGVIASCAVLVHGVTRPGLSQRRRALEIGLAVFVGGLLTFTEQAQYLMGTLI